MADSPVFLDKIFQEIRKYMIFLNFIVMHFLALRRIKRQDFFRKTVVYGCSKITADLEINPALCVQSIYAYLYSSDIAQLSV